MCTFLGASVEFTDDDVDQAIVEAPKIVYLEGYLFDAEAARRAFAKAAAWRHGAGRMIALTLSDSFVVERHRAACWASSRARSTCCSPTRRVCALFETADFDEAVRALRAARSWRRSPAARRAR
jgi:sugar/nucleoside kinase (ribokinase family)